MLSYMELRAQLLLDGWLPLCGSVVSKWTIRYVSIRYVSIQTDKMESVAENLFGIRSLFSCSVLSVYVLRLIDCWLGGRGLSDWASC